jgi:hypothetical protein
MPVAVGENVTLIAQFFLLAMVVEQVEAKTAKMLVVENEMPVSTAPET